MARAPNIGQQFFDDAGNPLIDGLIDVFESGSTTTKKDTFADINETVKNPNPMELTAAGRLRPTFFGGAAKFITRTSAGQQIETLDPITAPGSSSFGDPFNALTIYSLNQVVTFNNRLYISIIGNNSNNEPPSNTQAWSEFDVVERYNANQTYEVRDPVTATDFNVYVSLVANNLNNEPSVSPTEWQPTGTGVGFNTFSGWDISITYGLAGNNIVTASNGEYYVSLAAGNVANDPTSSPTFWTQVDFVKIWNSNEAYIAGDVVRGTDDYVYVAQQGTTGDDPVTDTAGTNWGPRTADEIATLQTDLTSQPASNIVSGTFDTARIPNLDASKTTTGAFADARIPNLNASKTNAGTFADARIPNLNASKTNAGTFADARIPSLAATKITSGVFADARIPSLNASKTNAGVFADARIPNLNASKTTAGTFNAARIPAATTSAAGKTIKPTFSDATNGHMWDKESGHFSMWGQVSGLGLNTWNTVTLSSISGATINSIRNAQVTVVGNGTTTLGSGGNADTGANISGTTLKIWNGGGGATSLYWHIDGKAS